MKKILVLLLSLALLFPLIASADYAKSMAATSLAGASAAKIHNIKRAAAKINGMTLPRGKVFSFNDIVGPRRKSTGYLMEPNGFGDPVFGGGVSQIATTLNIAFKTFDDSIQILEKHSFGAAFKDHYVPAGEEALWVSYSEGKNFAFTDNFQSIQIDVWVEDQQLHCLVKGAGDGPGYSDPMPEPEIPASNNIKYGLLKGFDPATDIAHFQLFEMLFGQAAVDHLVQHEGYSVAEAWGHVDNMADMEYVTRYSPTVQYVDIKEASFLLLYQPSGDEMPEPQGIPSNAGDFRAIWQVNPSLLMDNHHYEIHYKNDQPVYFEQMFE